MYALLLVADSKWAFELEAILNPLGYESTKSANALETLEIIKAQPIDLIICETVVNRDDTVTLLQRIPNLQCPVIFMTDSPTESIYTQTTQFKQARFLVKPFHRLTLRSAIESLTNNPIPSPATQIAPPVTQHDLLASKGIKVRSASGQRLLLTLDKILWISADKNHCFIHTRQNHYILKQSLTRLSKQLDERFIQVHKGFWVNTDYITRVNLDRRQVYIDEEAIPIGRTYRDRLAEYLLDKSTIRL